MKTPSLLFAAAVAGLAPSLSAQLEFDLILPDTFDVQAYDPWNPYTTKAGILVNTGTVPITRIDWIYLAMHAGHSSEDLDWFQMVPKAEGWDVLMPGEAVGNSNAQYIALLQPGETLAYPNEPMLDIRIDGAIGHTPLLTFALEFGDQRVRAELRPTIVDLPGWPPITLGTAKRWSSETVTPGFAQVHPGCPLPTWDMPLYLDAGYFPDGGTISKGSDLPVLGNDRIVLNYPSLPPPEVGAVWMFLVSKPGPPVVVLGCEVLAMPVLYDQGIVPPIFPSESTSNPGYYAIDIPDAPGLAGYEVDVQWGIFSPNAANGVFATSPGHRVHLIDLGV